MLTALVTTSIVAFGVSQLPSSYTSSAKLRVLTVPGGGNSYIEYDILYSDRLMNTYSQIATSDPILTRVAQQLNMEDLPSISVEVIPNTEILAIIVEGENPELITAVGNSLAEILVERSHELYQGYITALSEQNGDLEIASNIGVEMVSIVEPAMVPTIPSGPNRLMLGLAGLLVGLSGGVGCALLLENLDTRIRRDEQLELSTRLPILGHIPSAKKKRRGWIFVSGDDRKNSYLFIIYPYAEAFRRLRTSFLTVIAENNHKSVAIISAQPKEGKSTLLVNLGLSLAQIGLRVTIIDGDLRRPTIHSKLNLSNDVGLSSVLENKVPLGEAIQASNFSNLRILTSGPIPYNPSELLSSSQMHLIIESCKSHSDILLIDTPAALAVADALILASIVDGVAAVVSLKHARKSTLYALIKEMDAVKAKPGMLIANHSNVDINKRYREYYSRSLARYSTNIPSLPLPQGIIDERLINDASRANHVSHQFR